MNKIIHNNILDKIVARKKQEIAEARLSITAAQLEQSELFSRGCYSMRTFMEDPEKTGIIAEFKRSSPSKGLINGYSSIKEVTTGYAAAGAR